MKSKMGILAFLFACGCSKGGDALEQEVAQLKSAVSRLEKDLQEERGRTSSNRVEIEALQKAMGSVASPDDEKLREKIADVMREQRPEGLRGFRGGGFFRPRPYLGVQTAEATEEARKAAGLKEGTGGAFLERVVPDSPAHKAGLREGDIILAVGTREVRDPADLVDAVSNARAGDRLSIRLARKGGQGPTTMEIVLAEAPRGGRLGGPRPPGDGAERQPPAEPPAKAPPREPQVPKDWAPAPVPVPAPVPPPVPEPAPDPIP